ncbi:MAG: DUF3102 domain-containing protein [Planctomycetota bacterium]
MTTKAMTTAGLKQLAKKANAAAAASETHAKNAVAKAIEAGELLAQAKSKVDHGQWLSWLGENWEYKQRWAQSLMRLADRKADVIESAQTVPHALRLIEDSESDASNAHSHNESEGSNAHADAHLKQKNSQKQGSNEISPTENQSGGEPGSEVVDAPEIEPAEESLTEAEMALENASVGREIVNSIRTTIKLIKSVSEAPGTELLVDRQRSIIRELENAKNSVTVTIPKSICPRCNGKGCPQCGNMGWINSVLSRELGA